MNLWVLLPTWTSFRYRIDPITQQRSTVVSDYIIYVFSQRLNSHQFKILKFERTHRYGLLSIVKPIVIYIQNLYILCNQIQSRRISREKLTKHQSVTPPCTIKCESMALFTNRFTKLILVQYRYCKTFVWGNRRNYSGLIICFPLLSSHPIYF